MTLHNIIYFACTYSDLNMEVKFTVNNSENCEMVSHTFENGDKGLVAVFGRL